MRHQIVEYLQDGVVHVPIEQAGDEVELGGRVLLFLADKFIFRDRFRDLVLPPIRRGFGRFVPHFCNYVLIPIGIAPRRTPLPFFAIRRNRRRKFNLLKENNCLAIKETFLRIAKYF